MRKNATKLAALALTLAMTVTSVALPNSASAATKTVKLNTTSKTLYATGSSAKKTTTLKVTVNGKKKTATFKSSNTKVATVGKTSGKVTAKKAGKATITATYGGKKVTCKITVKAKFVKVTSVSVSPKTVSLAVGKTKTIKTTVKPSKASIKKVTYASSNKSVATVTSAGKITAKKAGTAKVTVTATDGTKKKATVTVKVTKATTPTATPSTEPTTAPTPTATPAQTATSASAAAVITSAKQTGSSEFKVEFSAPVSATATVKVAKDGKDVPGTATFDAERKSVVFAGKAKFADAEYTITVTDGATILTEKVAAKAEKLADIKIIGTTALTGKATDTAGDNTAAYIYYDVLNQFGESIRTSEDINWTISSSTNTIEDKATGRLKIVKEKFSNGVGTGDYETYTYGTDIYIVGVNVKSGISVNQSVKIGMEQAIHEVEFKGFIDTKTDKTKLLDALPENFQKNRYVLCYAALDQNRNKIEAREYDTKELTLIATNPLVVSSTFTKDRVYTIDGVEYASVMVQPGTYVDNGGDVEFTMISNKTGQKTSKLYHVGEAAKLKSLTIVKPSAIFADGDQNKVLDYVAVDTKGNETKDYDTIVRSTNSLTLSASQGKVVIKENEKGEAVVLWSDDTRFENNYSEPSSWDGQPRVETISTIVAGGESKNLTFNILDTRRPAAINAIKLNRDNNDSIVEGNVAKMNLIEASADNILKQPNVTYLDQYQEPLSETAAKKFFEKAKDDFNGKKYAIKVTSKSADKDRLPATVRDQHDLTDANNLKGEVAYYTQGADKFDFVAANLSTNNTLTKLADAYNAVPTINAGDSGTISESEKANVEAFIAKVEAAINATEAVRGDVSLTKLTDLKEKLSTLKNDYATIVPNDVNTKVSAVATAIGASTGVDGLQKEINDKADDMKTKRANVTVKYAIVAKDSSANVPDTKYTEVSKVVTKEYKVLPQKEVQDKLNIEFNAKKIAVNNDDRSKYANLAAAGVEDGIPDAAGAYAANTTGLNKVDVDTNKRNAEFVVKGTTADGITVTIPMEDYESNALYAIVSNKSQMTIAASDETHDKEAAKIDALNDTGLSNAEDGALSEADFYNADTAKGVRKDAIGKLVLKVFGSTDVAKSVALSDGKPVATDIKFKTTSIEPNGTAETLTPDGVAKGVDQYNCEYSISGTNATVTVGDIVESVVAFNHVPSSFSPSGNGTGSVAITGAEVADKFKVTVAIDNSNVSKTVDFVVKADKQAKISNKTSDNLDKAFREDKLNMKRD